MTRLLEMPYKEIAPCLFRGKGRWAWGHRPSPLGGEAVLETTSEAMWLFCLRVNPVLTELS